MVYILLKDVVDKTTQKLENKKQARMNLKERYERDLDETKKELIAKMENKSSELIVRFSAEAEDSINTYANKHLDYSYSLEELHLLNEKYVNENVEQYNLDDKKKDFSEEREKMFGDLKEKVKDFSLKDIKGSISEIAEGAKKSMESISSTMKELNKTKKDASSETVEEVLDEVDEKFKNSRYDAIKKINHIACDYWEKNFLMLKNELIDIVTVSDALTDNQKKNVSELIFNYENIKYNDQVESRFEKNRFLKGHLLGVDLFTFEKLNINKLAKDYKTKIEKEIKEISNEMNTIYYNKFIEFKDKLRKKIDDNIVKLNPELQVISDSIDNEIEKINILEMNQNKIGASLKAIEELLSFKIIEE